MAPVETGRVAEVQDTRGNPVRGGNPPTRSAGEWIIHKDRRQDRRFALVGQRVSTQARIYLVRVFLPMLTPNVDPYLSTGLISWQFRHLRW